MERHPYQQEWVDRSFAILYTDGMSSNRASTLPKEPHRALPAWLTDLLLGIAVTAVIAIVITADQGGSHRPDGIAYLFACGFGGLMLVRNRFPIFTLIATMLLLFVYYALSYPAIGLAVPVSAALYSAAENGRLPAAIVVSLLLLIVSTYFRLLEGQSVAFLLGYELVSAATMMAAAIALGDGTRARHALRAEQEQTARLIEKEHAQRAEQRVEAERLRIARDLHDVIGHSISVISLHADVAREALGNDPEQAHQALTHIRNATSATMRELRTTVKLLRNPNKEPAERSVSSLANLSTLLDNARAGGLLVHLESQGDVQNLPATIDNAAFRIIQESITNVIRHANASELWLDIDVNAKALRLSIRDNGTTRSNAVEAGSGISGMGERARLLGGSCTAKPLANGGFAVTACLPREKSDDFSRVGG
ncbi:MAG: sensor histidine kinase [Caldilineaceae bacterium]